MQFHENTLYIEFRDFLTAGWKEDTIKKANLRNGSKWQMVKNPEDGRMPMVQFDTLVPAHKDKLNARFAPDVYTYMAKAPIKALVQKDPKAEDFYKTFTYDGRLLPVENQTRYTTAASWLNMLIKMNADKKYIKKVLNLSIDDFFKHVADIITVDNIMLPATYQRLRNRMAEYTTGGYEVLISDKFGNKCAAKIGKTDDGFDPELEAKQIALIRRLASMHNNFDAMQVTMLAKTIFDKNGWTMIGHGRMKQILAGMEHLTTPGKRGSKAYNNKLAMHVMREAPTHPLYYWTLDGWTAELLYQDATGYNNRMVIVVVLDAFNKYPIGYAIGERENTDLIRQALRNAALHVNELFGSMYRPWQVQSDNYGIKQLTPFYEAIGKLVIPAAVGNAKSKIIEPYFKYLNKTYCQTQYNWSGFNITARQENQPNVEFLNKIKKSLPGKDEVIAQIEYAMECEREKKLPEYQAQWAETPDTDKVVMAKPDMLMAFGQTTGFTNKINGFGLTPTINGQTLAFDTFEPAFRSLQHLKWQPVYNPEDLSQILAVSECGKHRFVLDAKMSVAMDVKSTTPEQHNYRAKITDFNKARREEVVKTYIEDAAIVDEIIATTPLQLTNRNEAALKLMFTDRTGQQKEGIQDAKGLKRLADKQAKEDARAIDTQAKHWQEMQMKYITDRIDLSEYE